MEIVGRLARVSRDPCWLPDYIQPIVSSIAPLTCDLSRLFDRNSVLSKVPALVLILSSMTQTTIVLERIVVAAVDFVDWVSHIQQVNPTIGI